MKTSHLLCLLAALVPLSCSSGENERPMSRRGADPVEEPRLVTLGGGATEIVYALGHGDEVVASDASSTYPASAAERSTLGYYRRVQAEGIIALAPTMVLASDGSGPPTALAQVETAGIRVVEVPPAQTLSEAKARIAFLADKLHEEERGAKLIASIEEELVTIAAAVSGRPPPRVLFIYARGGGTMLVAGVGTAAQSLIALAGGVLAAPRHQGFRPLTAEAVIEARPEVILLTDGGLETMGGVDGVLLAPGVRATPAGAERRIIAMDDLLLLSFGPRLGTAVRTLAEELHPGAIP